MNWLLILATTAFVALSAVTARAQVEGREIALPPIEDAADLAAVREQYRAAATGRDLVTLTRLFADDGVLVASDRDVIRGRVEIVKYFAKAFEAAAPPAVARTHVSAESRDGFGSETGQFVETVTGPEGAVAQVSGVYVTIYRRDAAGRWRVAIEIRSRGDRQPLGAW